MQSKPLTTTVSIHKNNEVIPFRSTPLANMGSHGIRVIRRDGSTTSLNIGKIRDVVEWACEGKKVNSIALAGGLSGCASGSGNLSIFLLSGSIPPRLLTDFRKTIAEKKVNFQSERQLKELLKLLEKWLKNQGQPASQFSISIPFREQKPAIGNLVTLGDAWLGKAITNGLIQPLDTSQLSNWSKLPPRWQENMARNAQGQPQTEGKVWGAPYRWGMTVIAYNEEKFAQFDWRPQDWSDLWRPELTGKIALIDNRREVIGLTLKKLGYSYNSSDLKQVTALKDQLFALQKQVNIPVVPPKINSLSKKPIAKRKSTGISIMPRLARKNSSSYTEKSSPMYREKTYISSMVTSGPILIVALACALSPKSPIITSLPISYSSGPVRSN